MGMFYKASDKQLLKDRNSIFKEVGITYLEMNGFKSAPFKMSWNGDYNKSIQGYSFEISRIEENKYLETINVYILRGEPWIQIYLNIFEILPELSSIIELKKYEGLGFGNLVNQKTRMRLRNDD